MTARPSNRRYVGTSAALAALAARDDTVQLRLEDAVGSDGRPETRVTIVGSAPTRPAPARRAPGTFTPRRPATPGQQVARRHVPPREVVYVQPATVEYRKGPTRPGWMPHLERWHKVAIGAGVVSVAVLCGGFLLLKFVSSLFAAAGSAAGAAATPFAIFAVILTVLLYLRVRARGSRTVSVKVTVRD